MVRGDWFVIAVTALAVASSLVTSTGSQARASAVPEAAPSSTVALQGSLGALSPRFWGIDMSCSSCPTQTESSAQYSSQSAALLNATPYVHNGSVWIRVMGQLECTNVSSGLCFGNGASTTASNYGPTLLGSLKTFCSWYTCHLTVGIAAEQNRTGYTAFAASDILGGVGLPASDVYAWAFGNEPSNFKHWGIPWGSWQATDNAKPGPVAYAWAVKNMTAALRAVLPGASIDAGEMASSPDNWYTDTASVNPGAVDVGAHLYPNGNGFANETLAQFIQKVTVTNGIQTQIPSARAAIKAGCGCSSIAYDIHEFGLTLSSTFVSAYLGTPASTAMLAQVYLTAMNYNVSQINQFDWMDTNQGLIGDSPGYAPAASYYLFTQIFDRMNGGTVWNATVSGLPGLYATLEVDPATSGRSLLLVNLNTTFSSTVDVPPSVIPSGMNWTVYTLNGNHSQVAGVQHLIGAPDQTLTLAPFDVVLVNAQNPGGSGANRPGGVLAPNQSASTAPCSSLVCQLPEIHLPALTLPEILGAVLLATAVLSAVNGRRAPRYPAVLLLLGGLALIAVGGG